MISCSYFQNSSFFVKIKSLAVWSESIISLAMNIEQEQAVELTINKSLVSQKHVHICIQ